jgi:D-alanyl-D-alanine carboxypeptidase
MIGRRILRACTIAASFALATVATAAPKCAQEFAPLVETRMAELGVPGLIVHVEVPGVCRWAATLGTGDLAKRQNLPLNSHVRIGSVTKTLTGTVVLQLVDEGRIQLDYPIAAYLSGVPNGENITVRQILKMTSGLYNYSEEPGFNQSLDDDLQRVWTVDELLDIGLSEPPYFQPDQGFHYSNTNTVLLGRLIETVTGNPLAAEFERRIFRPLRMTQSSMPAAQDTSIPRPHPRGYTYGTNVGTLDGCDARTVGPRDVTHASHSWTWAAGGAISTLHDLKIWARALALGTLLSTETQAERLDGVPVSPAPDAARYGLHVVNFNGIIGHNGALAGFSSFIGYVPAKDATIVVLANLYPDLECGVPAHKIANLIAEQLGLFTPQAGQP